MEQNIFSPRIKQENADSLSGTMRSLAQWVMIAVFGLLPLFFIPSLYTSVGFVKVYFVSLGIFAVIVLLSLSILRSGNLKLVMPASLAFFWLFTLTALASGLLSGDVKDALYGNTLEIHTVSFFVLMALIMTTAMSFSGSKGSVARLFIFLGIGAALLQIYHTLRLFFGADFLSFGIFSVPTVSPLGSFNDLAIFSGLVIIVALIIIQQISYHLLGRVVSGFLIVNSLLILSIINFYIVWLVLGFLSLLMFLYLISKDTWLKSEDDSLPVPRFVLVTVATVCLFSGAFIISGQYLGDAISSKTQISYLEVRPSVSATLDISRSVAGQNVLLGIGPNRFEDAWRQYKNPVINQTIFWNTNFSAGSGYIPTIFITTGIAGGGLFIMFLLGFIYLGYKTLFTIKSVDSGWYLVGTISFITSIYLWFMALVYVPGVVILLLAALMTGISFAVYKTVSPEKGLIVDVVKNRQHGFLLIAAVLMLVTSATLTTISVSKQFIAGVIYADTIKDFQEGADLITTDAGLARSQDLNKQDIFVSERAQLRLLQLNQLSTADPANVDQQKYIKLLAEGIGFAEQAISLDDKNPANQILLSNFYSLLNPIEFEGLAEKNTALFDKAQMLDPTNPSYSILRAQYMARTGDLVATRKYLMEAVSKKSDYTDALFLISQLDIQEGKTADAIAVTRSIISIEPTNPTRYFQLGVLLATTNNLDEAVSVLETAVGLDVNYANARYFLALAYLDRDRKDDALVQLRIIEETNRDNQMIKELIGQVEDGSYKKSEPVSEVPVKGDSGVSQQEGVTTSTVAPNTDLLTPINNTGAKKIDSTPEPEIIISEPEETSN